MRRILLVAAVTWLSLICAALALAADLPTAAPAEVGIGRLDRISQMFKADTDARRIPGAVV